MMVAIVFSFVFFPGRPRGSPVQYAPDYLIYVDFASVALQFGAHGLQEAACARAIEDAMVEREAQVHHVTHGDGVVLDDDWAFDDGIHAQYASVRLVNNRH